MTPTLQSLMDARTEAHRALREATVAASTAEIALRRQGLAEFTAALAERGIVEGCHIVIEGAYSAPWEARVCDLRHGTETVYFRGASVDSTPERNPHPNSTGNQWRFRVAIARLEKNGQPRDECRSFLANGDTPQAAAEGILKA